MRTVRDLMSTDVRSVHRDTLVCEIAGIFSAAKVSGAPVIDDGGSTVGFVSNSDVARFDSTGEDPSYARVHEIASPRIVSVSPNATIKEAADKMLTERVHHLVVIERELTIGILSSLDFVKLAAAELNDVPASETT